MDRKIALSVLVLLGGCGAIHTPVQDRLPQLPDAFSTPTGRYQPNEFWWRDFHDEQLNFLMQAALVRNLEVQRAIVRTQIAQAQLRAVGADLLPQAGVRFGPTRFRSNLPGLDGPVRMISTNYAANLSVSWEVDLWGRLSAMSAAARSDFLASHDQLRAVRQAIAARVVQVYLQIVHDKAQLALSEHTVRTLAETARQVGNRVHAGLAAPTDGLLAQTSLQVARSGLESRRQALEGSMRQLGLLLASYPDGRVQTADALPEVPAAPAAGVPAELLARRPDVRAADRALVAAGYRLGAAQRSFLPTLALTGSTGFSAGEFANLFSSSNLVWSIAGALLQPVFQGGRLVAQVEMARGAQDEALISYARMALNALAEVETALAIGSIAAQQTQALHVAADQAAQAQRVSFNRYMQGIDPFLMVLESQRLALETRSAEITSQLAALNNRVGLILALGGGFENMPDAATAVLYEVEGESAP